MHSRRKAQLISLIMTPDYSLREANFMKVAYLMKLAYSMEVACSTIGNYFNMEVTHSMDITNSRRGPTP